MDPRIQRTRERVLNAAHELLRERGPGGVTYSALAEHSGVGRATLYRHWSDIDTLLQDLVSSRAAARQIEFSGNVSADLRLALRVMHERIGGTDRRVELVTMLERAHRDPTVRRFLMTMERMMPVRRALDLAVVNEQLPAETDLELAVSLLLGPVLHRDLMGSGNVDEAFIDAVVEAFLDQAEDS